MRTICRDIDNVHHQILQTLPGIASSLGHSSAICPGGGGGGGGGGEGEGEGGGKEGGRGRGGRREGGRREGEGGGEGGREGLKLMIRGGEVRGDGVTQEAVREEELDIVRRSGGRDKV